MEAKRCYRKVSNNYCERPVNKRTKYSPSYSSLIKGIALFHFISINLLLTFLLYNFSDLSVNFKLAYGFIIVNFNFWFHFFDGFSLLGHLVFEIVKIYFCRYYYYRLSSISSSFCLTDFFLFLSY